MRFAVSVFVLTVASLVPAAAAAARETRGLGIPEPAHPLHKKMHKGLHPHPSVFWEACSCNESEEGSGGWGS